jgi:hypothetical protein
MWTGTVGINRAKYVSWPLFPLKNTQTSLGFRQQCSITEVIVQFFFCFLDRAFFNYEENNQQNAPI